LGDKPLSDQYPSMYGIVQRKEVFVAHVFQHPLNIAFRRSLDDTKWARWTHLPTRLMDIRLTAQPNNKIRCFHGQVYVSRLHA
jgi:hypothetical protein